MLVTFYGKLFVYFTRRASHPGSARPPGGFGAQQFLRPGIANWRGGWSRRSIPTAFEVAGMQTPEAESGLVSITVLSVTPMRAGRIFSLASVEIDIDGVRIEVHGLRAMRNPAGGTRVELPTFRDASGQSRAAIVLPDEIYRPIGEAVVEVLIERGALKRRFIVPMPD
jgi:hypothetical protein